MALSKITNLSITDDAVRTVGIQDAAVTAAKTSGIPARPNAQPLMVGDMQVAQRGTSTASITGTTDDYYTCDRWAFQVNDSSVWTQSQDTDVPSGYGFGKSIKLDCTTLDATPTFTVLQQKLEGQNLQLLKKGTASAESLTLSFWVKSVKTGTYICELRDYDNNRTISKAYTVDSGSTWEQKFLNFAGDTTGTLDDDNAASLAVTFFLAVSSTYSSGTLATSWETRTNANRAVGQVNLSDSTSNDFWLTAVQLEVGEYTSSTIPPFQHESYGDNLLRCQRYFVQFGNNQGVADQGDYGLGIANNDDEGCHILIPLPTTMRTASSTITQSGTASDYAVRTTTTDACTGVPVFADATTSNIQVKFVNNGHGFGTGVVVRGMTNADPSFIGVSAEL